jgi:hypothetical protein
MYVCKNMNNVKNIFCSTKKDTQKEENDVKMTGKMTEKGWKRTIHHFQEQQYSKYITKTRTVVVTNNNYPIHHPSVTPITVDY